MKKLICLAILPLVGCAYTAPGIERTTIYSAPALGDRVGDIIRIEDKEKGVVLYVKINGVGAATVQAFTVEGSKLTAAGR